jgi:hypothetical protein
VRVDPAVTLDERSWRDRLAANHMTGTRWITDTLVDRLLLDVHDELLDEHDELRATIAADLATLSPDEPLALVRRAIGLTLGSPQFQRY